MELTTFWQRLKSYSSSFAIRSADCITSYWRLLCECYLWASETLSILRLQSKTASNDCAVVYREIFTKHRWGAKLYIIPGRMLSCFLWLIYTKPSQGPPANTISLWKFSGGNRLSIVYLAKSWNCVSMFFVGLPRDIKENWCTVRCIWLYRSHLARSLLAHLDSFQISSTDHAPGYVSNRSRLYAARQGHLSCTM